MGMSAEGQIAKSSQKVSAQPKKKKRLGYMDIARGIAMLCIIMGHFGIVTVNRFVYSFHVPFFFLLSGYFYSQRGTWKEFILTKAKQLLIPYAIGVAGIMIATSICFPLLGYSLLDLALRLKYILKAGILGAGTLHMVPFEIHQIGALWFLLALFFGNIILRFALQTKGSVLGRRRFCTCGLGFVSIYLASVFRAAGYVCVLVSVFGLPCKAEELSSETSSLVGGCRICSAVGVLHLDAFQREHRRNRHQWWLDCDGWRDLRFVYRCAGIKVHSPAYKADCKISQLFWSNHSCCVDFPRYVRFRVSLVSALRCPCGYRHRETSIPYRYRVLQRRVAVAWRWLD